jgi:hypothetical protein
MTARCNELIYKKLRPAADDETYLRADSTKQLFVEKIERDASEPNPLAIKSVLTLWALDAKIFDDGKGGSASIVIARGPGRLETRPARDKSVEQSATWKNEMVMITTAADRDIRLDTAAAISPKDGPAPTKRKITLTGHPQMVDHTKETTIDADNVIVIDLEPKPAAKDGEKVAKAPAKPADVGQLDKRSKLKKRLFER